MKYNQTYSIMKNIITKLFLLINGMIPSLIHSMKHGMNKPIQEQLSFAELLNTQ